MKITKANQVTVSESEDLTLKESSWYSINMTEIKCKHCKKPLCITEVKICIKDWNYKGHHHYCCFVCFQEHHI